MSEMRENNSKELRMRLHNMTDREEISDETHNLVLATNSKLNEEKKSIEDDTQTYVETGRQYQKKTSEISEQNERLEKQLRQKEIILNRLKAENTKLKLLEQQYQGQLTSIGHSSESDGSDGSNGSQPREVLNLITNALNRNTSSGVKNSRKRRLQDRIKK